MMTMKINLRAHSNTSNGSLSVEKLMDILKEYHYDLVALTDHDTAVGNGIAIWAHPYIICKNGDYSINSSEVEQIFKYMVNNEIDGLESYYLQFIDEQQKFLELLAKKYSKMSSTGTDFHADFAWEYKLLEQTTPIDEKMIQYLNDQQKILKIR